jgi:hypothetical protein
MCDVRSATIKRFIESKNKGVVSVVSIVVLVVVVVVRSGWSGGGSE